MEPMSFVLDLAPWITAIIVSTTAIGVFAAHQGTKLKIKNGYPLEGMWGQSLKPHTTSESAERIKLLTQENAQLRAEMSSVKERLANVERIVTDGGFGLSQQIAALETTTPLELVASRDKTRA